jgi:hypothetical protein
MTESRGNLEKKLLVVVVDGGASESKGGEDAGGRRGCSFSTLIVCNRYFCASGRNAVRDHPSFTTLRPPQ